MKFFHYFRCLAEYAEGCFDESSIAARLRGAAIESLQGDEDLTGKRIGLGWVWHGIWWGVLAALILLFSGQTSKFIYIDF
jgi:hypothetical protein